MPETTYDNMVKIVARKKLVESWKKNVFDQSCLIDPNFTLHWESLALGYALGQGCDLAMANEVVTQIRLSRLL